MRKNFILKGRITMRRIKVLWMVGICLVCAMAFSTAVCAAEAEPKVGHMAGNVKFSKVVSPEDQQYLGLASDGPFTLKDIKGEYFFLESFNTTCPHCMAQAPVLNNLFAMVEKDAGLKGKVKFISAGQGNNDQNAKMWKTFHKVPFPVVPDPDRLLSKALNFSPYPVSVLVDKSGKVLWVHVGSFESAEEAFKAIKPLVK
jgi:thiol-disulfide isomerase/thioredoxin